MTTRNYKRNATMALYMDAGNRDGKPRCVFVLLDAGANAVDVVEGDSSALEKAGYKEIPTFGPIDVKSGTHREMLRLKRQGNPEVRQRRDGRWHRRTNHGAFGATIGERAPNVIAMKHRLLRRRDKEK